MQPTSGFVSETDTPLLTNSIWDALHSRRSIRAYRDEPVPLDLVKELLTIAGLAPSAHNRQPWRWVVVADPATRRDLADAMGEDFAHDLKRDDINEESIQKMVGRSRERISGAPMIIVPCLSMAEMDHYPDAQRQHHEWHMAVQSSALACQNLMLAAHAVGLGSRWICAPIFCAPTVQSALALPPDWQPQALITLGYPAEAGRTRPRKAIADITLYR